MTDLLIRILADGLVLAVIAIGAWAVLFKIKNNRYQSYCRILMAGLMAYLFAKLIGSVYQPELQRPFELLGMQAGASYLNNPGFPSDHVLFCSAITLAVWFETKMKRVTVLLITLTVLVGAGRILALVHAPIDVIGGVAIALVGGLWYLMNTSNATPVPRKHWSKPYKHGKVS